MAHDSHNIIVAGVSDAEMRAAVTAVVAMDGGFGAVMGERVLAQLPLPVAGLMSDQPLETVRDQMDCMIDAAQALGASLSDPFMTLGFLALPVIPDLKLTDQGWWTSPALRSCRCSSETRPGNGFNPIAHRGFS